MSVITDLYNNMNFKHDFKHDWKETTKLDWKVDWSLIVAPLAALVANVTSGAGPLSVQFTSNSTGTITSYLWDFGDGNTSTLRNPTHVYSTPGTYDVSLTVTGPSGLTNTGTRSGYIVVS